MNRSNTTRHIRSLPKKISGLRKKTNDGTDKGRISFYYRVLDVTRQGFYEHMKNRDKPWNYEALAAEIMEVIDEDECNDIYGRIRIHQA